MRKIEFRHVKQMNRCPNACLLQRSIDAVSACYEATVYISHHGLIQILIVL